MVRMSDAEQQTPAASESEIGTRLPRSRRQQNLIGAAIALGTLFLLSPLPLSRLNIQNVDTPGLYLGRRIGNLHLLMHYSWQPRPVFYHVRNRTTGNWGWTIQLWGKGIAVVWHPRDATYWADISP